MLEEVCSVHVWNNCAIVCVFLTIRDKPASSSRDKDIKLEGCCRMRPRLQLGHPSCQKQIKVICLCLIIFLLTSLICIWTVHTHISKGETTDSKVKLWAKLEWRVIEICKYPCLLRAQSWPGTPLQCALPPQGEVTLLIRSTAVDGCLQAHIYISLQVCIWHNQETKWENVKTPPRDTVDSKGESIKHSHCSLTDVI